MNIARSKQISKEDLSCSPNSDLIPGWYHILDNPRTWYYIDVENKKSAIVSLKINYTIATYKIDGFEYPSIKKRSISQLIVEEIMDQIERALL